MNVKQLSEAVGGLSKPSKMPGLSYGTPAKDCIVGSILRKKAGSVCSKCYAHKGMYSFPVVRDAQAKRLAILSANLEQWREDMTELLRRKYSKKTGDDRVFRWHDSGDLQSTAHLSAIVKIARSLPDIKFWLPTKEYSLVGKFCRTRKIPRNLIIRVSAPMIGSSYGPTLPGTVSSTVGAGTGFACGAYQREGKCGDCRACWDKSVLSVDYPQH